MALMNSKELIDRILSDLFSAEERRLAACVEDLVRKNKAFYPDKPHDGFIFYGEVFDTPGLVNGRRTRVSLSRKLEGEMNDFIKDRNTVDLDRKLISQTLFAILKPCSSPQDIRNALPECLVSSLPEYKFMPRTQPEAWTLAGDARQKMQYEKYASKIEFYSAARLLY